LTRPPLVAAFVYLAPAQTARSLAYGEVSPNAGSAPWEESEGREPRARASMTPNGRITAAPSRLSGAMGRYSWTTIKTLFGMSCNSCAMDGCEQKLTDPKWHQVNADIAHIRGEKPGAARYDASITPAERDGYPNLMLMCPGCHRRIDRLEPDLFPVDRLLEMKGRHEERCSGKWAPDEQLDRYAELLLVAVDEVAPQAHITGPPPRLELHLGEKESVYVVNVGEADALNARIVPIDDKTGDAWVATGTPPARLSPRARFRAGLHAATMGNAGPHVVRIEWQDADGRSYDAEYPLA
jgi:hypothetical protein